MRAELGQMIVLAVLFAMLRGTAIAGAVQIGTLDSSRYDDWICGENVPLSPPNGLVSCGSAKFGECSGCGNIAVRNDSNVTVKLRIKIIGGGFAPPCTGGAIAGFMKCPSGVSATFGFRDDCGTSLEPGKKCIRSVEFCPEKSGESEGEVRVSATAGSDPPKLTAFELAGIGNYTPELAAADEARRSRLDGLMKIPYVEKVELDTTTNDTAINVEVTEDDKIDQVRRLVPPRIGGYRTEVTTYSPVGCGL